MTIARRSILTGSAAGVGLVVAGAVPSLAEASPRGHGAAPQRRPHRPFPPLVDDPDGLLALPPGFSYRVVTYAGQTKLSDGQAPTPSNHDGTAVFDAPAQPAAADPEPRAAAPARRSAYRTSRAPSTTRGAQRRRLHGHRDRPPGPQPRRVGRHLRHAHQLRRRPDPVGHLADLRGDRDQGRHRLDRQTARPAPTRTTTATSSRSSPTARALPEPIKAFGRYAHEALAVDPEPHASVYLSEDASSPERPVLPLDRAARRHASGPASPTSSAPTAGTLEAMAILMDDGSVLPDVAYLTSAQLGRPFPVQLGRGARARRPDHLGAQAVRRRQVTRGKKFEGVWGTDEGVYVVNSFAFNTADLPADAVKHDGMVWFYSYADQTITLVTYFPHQTTSRHRRAAARTTTSPSTARTT